MSSRDDLLDVIGPWSEVKLDIIRKYAKAYSTILSGPKAAKAVRSYAYIDAFAGAGQHISGATGGLVPGSPTIALATEPPFNSYYFVDIDNQRVANLEQIAEARPEVTVLSGDANEVLLSQVLPHVADMNYLQVVQLARDTSQADVERALEALHASGELPRFERVVALGAEERPTIPDVHVGEVELAPYDGLTPDTAEEAAQ